jgi:spermidine synthase
MINKNILYVSVILFVEGFVSLAYQMLYIKQMTPFVGNSVEVVSWIVGVFLIALALGYKIGGKPVKDVETALSRNFLIAAILGGVFLSFLFIEALFNGLSKLIPAYYIMILYCFFIVAPTTFVLGQTIPLMTNHIKGSSVSEISGNVLFLSTVGSFLGAIVTTNIILKYFGVSTTIVVSAGLLLLLNIMISHHKKIAVLFMIIGCLSLYTINNRYENISYVATNQYASYEVLRYEKAKIRIFRSNQANSSVLDHEQKFGYIKLLENVLFNDMKIKDKNILVIGAGGFVVSKDIKDNHFTYVDIDPAVKEIAEKYFLGESINGTFIAQDGRAYINTTDKIYDVIILDAFSSDKSIPEHLSSVEFFKNVKEKIADNGLLVVNVIGKRNMSDAYTQNTYRTITSVFPYCFIQSSAYASKTTNIQFICNKVKDIGKIYTDNRNNSNSDFGKNGD